MLGSRNSMKEKWDKLHSDDRKTINWYAKRSYAAESPSYLKNENSPRDNVIAFQTWLTSLGSRLYKFAGVSNSTKKSSILKKESFLDERKKITFPSSINSYSKDLCRWKNVHIR